MGLIELLLRTAGTLIPASVGCFANFCERSCAATKIGSGRAFGTVNIHFDVGPMQLDLKLEKRIVV
jgi:hypothetical protein